MLFSNVNVAQLINERFEAAWESVHPVPIVTIDFGNGTNVTRTLHGNIATYVCNADGVALDILPGIYEPDVYHLRLTLLARLHEMTRSDRPESVTTMMRTYHSFAIEALKGAEKPAIMDADLGKAKIENPLKAIARYQAAPLAAPKAAMPKTRDKAEEIASWKELAEDTRINESARRLQVHAKLAASGSIKPNDIVKWLYKDVLHADLDDPYLGLGEILFKNYPFAAEEAGRR